MDCTKILHSAAQSPRFCTFYLDAYSFFLEAFTLLQEVHLSHAPSPLGIAGKVRLWGGSGGWCACRSGSAQAVGLVVRVSVGGQDWDVSTFTGSYNSNMAKFALPSSPGGVMPWWESESLASQFASAVGKGLGTQELGPGDKSPGDRLGPFFGYGASNDATRLDFDYLFALNEFASVVQTYSGVNRGIENTKWAQATPAAAPGPLTALGAASAFVYSRKLRNRIKASKAVSSKATTV